LTKTAQEKALFLRKKSFFNFKTGFSGNYITSMKEKFTDTDVHFQQDGAPAHRKKTTVEWIQNQISLVTNWPPNSPDLSVIENVWGILKLKVAERSPKTMPELREILIEEWNKLDQSMINNLIRSMTTRFRLCLQKSGDSIQHLLNKTTSELRAREPPVIFPPPDVTLPRNLTPPLLNLPVKCCARITSISTVEGFPNNCYWVRMYDPKAMVEEGSRLQTILARIPGTNNSEFQKGDFVVFGCTLRADRPVWPTHVSCKTIIRLSLEVRENLGPNDPFLRLVNSQRQNEQDNLQRETNSD
jgi:hypothetical protein